MTTTGTLQNLPKGRGLVGLLASFLALLAVLCTLFALVLTAAEGWQEHAQARWPEAMARVQRCGVDIYQLEYRWIDCSIRYAVSGEQIESHVHSLTTPTSRRLTWQYPAGRIARMQEWVDEHPEGTPMAVHYDPSNPKNAVLVTTDMPRGGPRTPGNLRLLWGAALSSAVLLTIARITRPKNAES